LHPLAETIDSIASAIEAALGQQLDGAA